MCRANHGEMRTLDADLPTCWDEEKDIVFFFFFFLLIYDCCERRMMGSWPSLWYNEESGSDIGRGYK